MTLVHAHALHSIEKFSYCIGPRLESEGLYYFPASRTRFSFRVRLSRDFSRLPQMESLLTGCGMLVVRQGVKIAVFGLTYVEALP